MSEGYQPNKGKLDVKNPPRGGSGVPKKPAAVIIVVVKQEKLR